FSCGVRGTPRCANTLNRVPELPNAHDGSSMRWAWRAATTVGLVVTSASAALTGDGAHAMVIASDRRRHRTGGDGVGDWRRVGSEMPAGVVVGPGETGPDVATGVGHRLTHVSIDCNCFLDITIRCMDSGDQQPIETRWLLPGPLRMSSRKERLCPVPPRARPTTCSPPSARTASHASSRSTAAPG